MSKEIKTQKQLERAVKNWVNSKGMFSQMEVELRLEEGGTVDTKIRVVQVPQSVGTEGFIKLDKAAILRLPSETVRIIQGDVGIGKYAPFSKDVLSVVFSRDSKALESDFADLVKHTCKYGLMIQMSPTVDIGEYVNGEYMSLLSEDTIVSGSHYKVAATTASGIRMNAMAMMSRLEDWLEFVDNMSSGSWSSVAGTHIQPSKAVKLQTRFGLLLGDARSFGRLNGWACKNNAVTRNNAALFDGMAWMPLSAAKRIFESHFGCSVSDNAALGMMLQFRFAPGLCKGACLIIPDAMFNRLVGLEADEVYGVPEILLDENCIKQPLFDRENASMEFLILKPAVAYPATLGSQAINKMIAHHGEAAVMEQLLPLLKTHVDEIIDETLNPRPRILTPFEAENGTLADIVPAISMKHVLSIPALYRSKVNNVASQLQKFSNRLKLRMSGNYRMVMPDQSILFGAKLLGFNEVYFKGAIDGERVINMRFPAGGHKEFHKATCVSEFVMWSRISKLNLNTEIKAALKSLVLSCPEGVLWVPADADLMSILAGMDFDGDYVVTYEDQWFVDMHWDIPDQIPCVVNPPNPKESLVLVDSAIFAYAIARTLSNPNKPIGIVANNCQCFVAQLSMKDGVHIEDFEHARSNKVYVSPIFVEDINKDGRMYERPTISLEDGAAIRVAYMNCNVHNVANHESVLQDIIDWHSAVMGITIDATKNDWIVKLFIEPAFRNQSTFDFRVKIDWESGKIIDPIKNRAKSDIFFCRDFGKFPEDKILDDPIGNIQAAIFAYAMTQVEERLIVNENVYLPDEFMSKLQAMRPVDEATRCEYVDLMELVHHIRNAFGVVQSGIAQTDKYMYRRFLLALSDMNARLLAPYEMTRKAEMLLLASHLITPAYGSPTEPGLSTTKFNLLEFSQFESNQFAIAIAKDILLSYIIEDMDGPAICGSRIVAGDVVPGDVIHFGGGISDNCITEETIDGEFYVYEFEESLYAVKDIVIDIKDPEPGVCEFFIKGKTPVFKSIESKLFSGHVSLDSKFGTKILLDNKEAAQIRTEGFGHGGMGFIEMAKDAIGSKSGALRLSVINSGKKPLMMIVIDTNRTETH